MNYLKQLFNTPHNLWTVGQELVFSLMILGMLAVVFIIAGFVYWIVEEIKAHKDKKRIDKKEE